MINGGYFPLINGPICSLLQREGEQVTCNFYSIYPELPQTSPFVHPHIFTVFMSVGMKDSGCSVQDQPWKCLQPGAVAN